VHIREVPSLRPKKSLGQNFLRDENISRKIVAAINVDPNDVIVEIGPGEGALTKYLAPRVRKLIVVDIDDRVITQMTHTYPHGEVEVVHEDVLETDLSRIAQTHGGPIRIVGNIPYNITSPILFHVLDNREHVIDATLMLQKEVARRLVGIPATKEYGILSVVCQLFADVRVLFDVSPNAFYPKPRVTSSVVRLDILPSPRYAVVHEQFARKMIRAVFGKRRKMLRNSLAYFLEESDGMPLDELGDVLQRRPEELTVEQLVELANTLYLRTHRATEN